MKTRLAICSILLAFGWAMARTGSLDSAVDRSKKPRQQRASRLVEIVAETPEYRLVRHRFGETKVPLAPRRIASLTGAATDGLVALGIRPVIAEGSWMSEGPPPYLAERLKGVPLIRQGRGVNLEAVLAAKPDLIFTGGFQDAKLYGQLSKIAPTVPVTSLTEGYRESRILDVGEVIGQPKLARKRLAEYRQYLKRARAALAAEAKGQPVAFLRFRWNTCVIYTQTGMFGPLLFEQLGLEPDPAMPTVMATGGWDVLSVERLSTLRAEHIFVVIDSNTQMYFDDVAQTPIWRNIPAVKHEHVHQVSLGTWLGGDGLLGCRAIVDDVLAAMISQRSNHASP